MRKPKDPKDLAIALLSRSPCSVAVGAVLADGYGIYSWGWNSVGCDGFGEHAEAHCLRRANRRRLGGSTLYVAARRARNGRVVTARPCPRCQSLVKRCETVVYRDGGGEWKLLH